MQARPGNDYKKSKLRQRQRITGDKGGVIDVADPTALGLTTEAVIVSRHVHWCC